MRKGIYTSEFWLAVIANLVGAMMASGVFADGSTWARALGLAAMVLTGLGYSVSRGMVKSSAPYVPVAAPVAEVKAP